MGRREKALETIWDSLVEFHDAQLAIPTDEEYEAHDTLVQTIKAYKNYKKYRKPMLVSRKSEYAIAYCPRCGTCLMDEFHSPFCRECGQKLDWSVE